MGEASVYLIGADADGSMKLGFTSNPARRLIDLQHVMPYRLRLLEDWRFPSRPFAYAVEQAAHAILWRRRLSGEWFDISLPEAGKAVDQASAMIHFEAADFDAARDVGERMLWLHVVGRMGAVFAEFEAAIGKERTMAGLARARAEGRIGGATAKHSDEAILEAAKLGTKPGARKLKMSVSGFIKAVARVKAKQLQESGDAD